jgi:hypothetical protein
VRGKESTTYVKAQSELKRKALDSCGNRGKVETPQGASPRRLDFLPAGKQVPEAERNGPLSKQPLILTNHSPSFLQKSQEYINPPQHRHEIVRHSIF